MGSRGNILPWFLSWIRFNSDIEKVTDKLFSQHGVPFTMHNHTTTENYSQVIFFILLGTFMIKSTSK